MTAPAAPASATEPLPVLPTSVVGSYSVPEWLERAKTGVYHGSVSRAHLAEMHDMAIKAAIKDQELAGIDIVSDGELRRDNDIDYVLERLPGAHVHNPVKAFYFDYLDVALTRPLPDFEPGPLGLARDLRFTRAHTDRPVKFSLTGPFSLARRVRNEAYDDPAELVRALARALNAEARALVAEGAQLIQIDEPFLAGYPEAAELAIEAINIVTKDVPATWALHVCYGNRYARPLWEGHYDFLFPAVLDASVDQLVLEFGRKGEADLPLLRRYGWDRAVGVGVVDVKTEQVEPAEVIRTRIRRALDVVPPDQMIVNPDCGLRHLPGDVARGKLRAMVDATMAVRSELQPPARREGEQ
ncbi:MAG TPA: hypothetical protein VM367_00890 [Pseudonocardia sp.]|jgi:5-methyltetrahydropteroyltriglutamate--homocysteine methyltransferase|nr:hypothetical protein [Pseudonocardia sp.]